MSVNIAGIVPASGKSSRMGKDKRNLPIGETTILESTLNSLLNGGCYPVILVVDSDFLKQFKSNLQQNTGLIVTSLVQESLSMLDTIIHGLKFIPEDTFGIAVLPADCPLISNTTINDLNSIFVRDSPDFLVPFYEGKQGHPRYFSKKMVTNLVKLQPEGRFSNLFKNHKEKVLHVDVGDKHIAMDIDTPEDYSSILINYDKLK